MKTIQSIIFFVLMSAIITSCVHIRHPFTTKLTRGNWKENTSNLNFEELPLLVKDTLFNYYTSYYSRENVIYSELISLSEGVNICLKMYSTFPSKNLFEVPGYYFSLGAKKYFFDYRKFKTPIVYYENSLYYFSGNYMVNKERLKFEDQSDFENKIFVKYKLKLSDKYLKSDKQECKQESGYNFINDIAP